MRKEIVLETLREEMERAQSRREECEAKATNGISITAEYYWGRADALRLAISLVELIDDCGDKSDQDNVPDSQNLVAKILEVFPEFADSVVASVKDFLRYALELD